MSFPEITDEEWQQLRQKFGDVAVENPRMLSDLLKLLKLLSAGDK